MSWDLIETHFRDLMRVAISVREGTISLAPGAVRATAPAGQ
ncbi:Tn3 family transposase [Actinacidiphila oryziradicis]|uniref:Uncharacterized protein n=1 Tax=Actinacidiphila oryziradicis TaxID=2571141 RepID=A0A4U0SKG6_9ACTN|nr:hypothetical protein FCI23_17995 [Actinacidiphila oryziradicis]